MHQSVKFVSIFCPLKVFLVNCGVTFNRRREFSLVKLDGSSKELDKILSKNVETERIVLFLKEMKVLE